MHHSEDMSLDNRFGFPAAGIADLPEVTLLAIDDVSLPIRRNVCLHLTKPRVRAVPVLRPEPAKSDAPDNAAAHFYGTVLRDGGRFRMWYYACHWGRNPDWTPQQHQQIAKKPGWIESDVGLHQGPLCHAESDDGIAWRKPPLGQVTFKGSSENNALDLPHTIVSGATVIRDDADPDPNRRYKLVYQFFPDQTDPVIPEFGTAPTIATAVSSDGIHWGDFRMPFINEFVEHSSFYVHDGMYIVNYQTIGQLSHCAEGGSDCGKTGMVKLSPNFDSWIDGHAVSFALPEPVDHEQRLNGRYDQVHLGVGAHSMGNVCVGLYGRWHNAPFGKDFHKISCDLGLVVSNDGLQFREPAKDAVFLRTSDSSATPVPGKDYNTNLCQANGILDVGDETRIYHGRWRNVGMDPETFADYYAEVALATIPRHRWGALRLNPGTTSGHVWSAPITLPSGPWHVSLNADRSETMRVELADREFRPIEGFSGELGGRSEAGEGLERRVTWAAGDPSRIGGATVRLKIEFGGGEDQALYAAYLRQS